MTTEQIIWNFLKSKNLTDFAAAGIMGNLQAESALRSNNLEDSRNASLGSDEEYTRNVDNGTYLNFITDNAGYGLAQWTSSDRKRKLYNLCKANNKSISDLTCQLVLLYEELNSLKILDQLQKANNVKDAAVIFLTKFEKPAGYNKASVQNTRAQLAQQFYDNLKSTKGGFGMEYENDYTPLVCMQTNSTCYRETSQMDIKGILWHSTGANNPNLRRYVQPSEDDPNYDQLMNLLGENTARNDWNHISMQAGLNAWIGKLANGQVATVQTMPWNYRPWGCGSGSRGSCNSGWIQFEICEDGLTDKNYFDKIYQEACQLSAYLCKKFGLNPLGSTQLNGVTVPVILCHQDSAQLGLGSNHADVYHWFTRFGKGMNDVRNDVAKIMEESGSSSVINPDDIDIIISDGILRKGDKGPEVQELQNNLIKLGYSVRYGADGVFGAGTEEAVMAFQRDYGLDDDGEVGPLTKAAIKKAIENQSTPQIYRVRKSWNDASSQVGAFTNLENAKALCDKFGAAYSVFDNTGKVVYSPSGNEQTVNPNYHVVPAKTYSDVMIGSASKDERGSYSGGQPGDQTGKEVWVLNWYDQNWDTVLRPKDAMLAEKIAIACEAACANNNVGYDQLTRNGLLAEVKRFNYDISKIDYPCNCDCSSLVSTCCVCAGLPENIFFANGNGCTTWTIANACLKTGRFDQLTDSKYLRQKDYLQRGDILLNTNQHVVIVLANGSLAEPKQSESKPVEDNSYIETSFLVRVTVPSLNIRRGPSTAEDIVAQIKKGGVYTIIATQGGFGRLKSGVGWIDLSYVERL